MIEVLTNQELYMTNLFCFRGKIKQTQLNEVGREMEEIMKSVDAKRCGDAISATYAMDSDSMDIEIMIPVDRKMGGNGNYFFKEQFKIANALKATYKGNPMEMQMFGNELNRYIEQNHLQPITSAYNVTRQMSYGDLNSTEVDIYVGINPNIL